MINISIDNQYIDLRGTPCPVNFIRCKLALEDLESEQNLLVDIDRGEPEFMVIPGLTKEGHKVEIVLEETKWMRLKVTCNG